MKLFSGFTKKLKRKKSSWLKERNRVHSDWHRSLLLFFGLIFLVAVVGVYMFLNADNIQISEVANPSDNTQNVIDQDLLNQTIDLYTQKAERFKELQDNFEGAPRI